MQHRARKRFGQNFLQDASVINHILQCINPQRDDNLIEIGPGLGALTQPLLEALSQLTVVELDRDLAARLRSHSPALKVIEADVLTVDFSSLGEAQRIVGNLPYNISTPILIHLLNYRAQIRDMHFMLQKEVVERMAAEPGSKTYGRLSVILQYTCMVEHLFDVPATAFQPMPKVESSVVRLMPYQSLPFDSVAIPHLEKIVKQAFATRRKTLRNNLKGILNEEDFSALGLSGNVRAEQLGVADFVKIARYCYG